MTSATTGSNTISYTYDAAGQPTDIGSPDGITGQLAHDQAGRLTELAYTDGTNTLSRFDYAYDAAGNVTDRASAIGPAAFGYDDIGRLTGAC